MKFLVLILAFAAAVLANDEEEIQRRALQNPDLYDGDMAGIDGPFDAERNAIPGQNYRWPNARVPYVIDGSLNSMAGAIRQAFNDYHTRTCIRFVQRTNERDYVNLFAGQGCYSHVGRTGGKQPLSLGQGCDPVGTIIHELGHALGFFHEQSRSDRDSYLIIYLQNVVSGQEHNFQKLSPTQNILFAPFDYDSIMIYGSDAFSKNRQPTMVARNGQKITNPYAKTVMTNTDVTKFKKMYNC